MDELDSKTFLDGSNQSSKIDKKKKKLLNLVARANIR
jgi:hypothetical protein